MSEHRTEVTLQELPQFVKELLVLLHADEKATVIALSGDLGAGKTTFVQTLAAALGITESVTSPTFTIMKGYETTDPTWKLLLHMDAYRIEDTNELRPLGFNNLLEQANTIFCIEWAEKIAESLPNDTVWLHLKNTADEERRTVRIEGLPVNS